MKAVKLEDLEKGDLIVVKWEDASELKLPLEVHKKQPDVYARDWGLYVGVAGRKRKLLLLAKDVVARHGYWGVTKIPVFLIDEVAVLIKAKDLVEAIPELPLLARRIRIRKYKRARVECLSG